jgi:hypothetical protein
MDACYAVNTGIIHRMGVIVPENCPIRGPHHLVDTRGRLEL